MKRIILLLFLCVNASQAMSWIFGAKSPIKKAEVARSLTDIIVQHPYATGLFVVTCAVCINSARIVDTEYGDVQKAIEKDKHIAHVYKKRLCYLVDPLNDTHDLRDAMTLDQMKKTYDGSIISCFQNEICKENTYACYLPEYLSRQYSKQFASLNDFKVERKASNYLKNVRQMEKFQATADRALAIIKRG